MANNKTVYVLQVENDVRKVLALRPATITELCDRTGHKYHTVRKAVRNLQEANIVFTSSVHARNQKYKIDPDAKPIAFMPMIANGSSRLPIVGLLNWVGKEDSMAAVGAVKNIAKIVTRILHYGVRSAEGVEVSADLLRIQKEVSNNIKLLENLISIYRQLLTAPELWSPAELAKITDDSRFDVDEVLNAYEHYYPSKGTEELVLED